MEFKWNMEFKTEYPVATPPSSTPSALVRNK
jgi:hypothetical protein